MLRSLITTAIIIGITLFNLSTFAKTEQFSDKVQFEVAKTFALQGKQDVLVFLKDKASLSSIKDRMDRSERHQMVYDLLREKAMETQKPLVSFLKSKKVGYKQYYITNVIFVRNAWPGLIAELSKRPDVRKILSNPRIAQVNPNTGDRSRTVETNVTYTGAKKVWYEFKVKGQNIVVAGQDTGVEWDNPALMKQYRGYSKKRTTHDYNWHDAVHNSPNNSCGSDLEAPCDDNDHGTHTIGTIVGHDGKENEIGVAPEAEWIACRNMDSGIGTPATYLECFEFFLAPYPHGGNAMNDGDIKKAPHVINNSWSCPEAEGCEGEEFLPILKALEKAGVMVVVSAGNDGPGCGTLNNPPAHHSNDVLSVGALNHSTEKIAAFSSRGPSGFDGKTGPHVVAPGVNIRSAVPGKKYAQNGWSGTSMAGPHVVGQVALMWSANPNLIGNIEKTKELIIKTAKPKKAEKSCGEDVTSVPNNTYGYGIIDIYESVKAAIEVR